VHFALQSRAVEALALIRVIVERAATDVDGAPTECVQPPVVARNDKRAMSCR